MPGRRVPVAVWLAIVFSLAGCQVKANVEISAKTDGSGTVTVAVGLDDAALKRFGDLDLGVKVDDLRAVGWTITPAAKAEDGLAWIKAAKPFANTAELNVVMGELAGPRGAFRDFTFETDDGLTSTTRRLQGTVDLTRGLDQFSDAELATALNGDRFGGWIPAIETAEGKPVADMISVVVRASVGGAPAKSYTPTLRDTALVQIDVAEVTSKPPPIVESLGGVGGFVLAAIVIAVLAVMLVGVRSRFRRAHR